MKIDHREKIAFMNYFILFCYSAWKTIQLKTIFRKCVPQPIVHSYHVECATDVHPVAKVMLHIGSEKDKTKCV